MQQSLFIGEYGTQADSTRRTVDDATDRLDLALLRIIGLIIQLQTDSRHILQCFFFRTILADQSQQLVFRHREVNVHIRIVGNGGQRFGDIGTNQCAYPIRQCTYHTVRRTFHYRIREIITGTHFLCFRLRQLRFGSQQRVFCRTQIE